MTTCTRSAEVQARQNPSMEERHEVPVLAEDLLAIVNSWERECQLSLRLFPLEDDHARVDGHTPKSMWEAQTELDGSQEKKRIQSCSDGKGGWNRMG